MKRKLCQLALAGFFWLICVGLFALSLLAVTAVGIEWHAIDYWLVWFTVISFAAALGCGTADVVCTAVFILLGGFLGSFGAMVLINWMAFR